MRDSWSMAIGAPEWDTAKGHTDDLYNVSPSPRLTSPPLPCPPPSGLEDAC